MQARMIYFSLVYSPFDKKALTQQDIDEIFANEEVDLVPIAEEFIRANSESPHKRFYANLCYGKPGKLSRKPRVFYNKDLSESKLFYAKAHELAHHLLHRRCAFLPFKPEDQETNNKVELLYAVREVEANLFANHVLFPEEELRRLFRTELIRAIFAEDYGRVHAIEEQAGEWCCRELSRQLPELNGKLSEKAKLHISLRVLEFRQGIEREVRILRQIDPDATAESSPESLDVYREYIKYVNNRAEADGA